MKNFLKKLSNSLISGIGFGAGFLMIIGIYLVYATGVFNLPSQVGTGSGLSATEWNKMVGSLDFLKSEVDGIKTIQNWQTPTLLNGWVNYDSVNWSLAGYFKDINGIVHLKGLIKNGTIGASTFYLPVGYRPTKRGVFITISSNGITNNIITRVDIDTSGNVIAGIDTGGNTWLSLDGITFRGEQ